MAANDNAPPVNARRTIAELEAELEKCTAERDEALARENAVAQVMQVINRLPSSLAGVRRSSSMRRRSSSSYGAAFSWAGMSRHPHRRPRVIALSN